MITHQKINGWLLQDSDSLKAEQAWRQDGATLWDFSHVWTSLWQSLTENQVKDTIWKTLHRVLTTKSYLASWGVSIDLNCIFCNQREDTNHALKNCPRASLLWNDLQPILNALNNEPTDTSLSHLLLDIDTRTKVPEHMVTQYLVHLAIHHLWTTRNKATFNNRQLAGIFQSPSPSYLAQIRHRIRRNMEYHPYFVTNYWTHRNVLCKLVNKELIFNI